MPPRLLCNLLLQISPSQSSSLLPQGWPLAPHTPWHIDPGFAEPAYRWRIKAFQKNCTRTCLPRYDCFTFCHVYYLLSCLLLCGKCCVSLLPQELSCPQERLGMFELPSLYNGEEMHTKLGALPWAILQPLTKEKKGILTTTLHHWLSLIGRSLWDWTHFA